jgi:hypothetical protein
VKNYHREGGKPRCAVKVNLIKAYDSVDWNFILQYLLCVDTGLECITTPKFSIALNDTLVGYFEGKKGLRQGDPISPYLFVLAMEVFSRLLEEASLKDKAFQFHPGYAAIKLADLWFGDDLLLFSWASCKLFRVCFSLRFDHKPCKSSFFSSGVSVGLKEQIGDCLQMREGSLTVRYLGFPLISKKLSAGDCELLIQKISGRVKSWLSKNLTFAGRLQLLSYVLCNI